MFQIYKITNRPDEEITTQARIITRKNINT